ncbi:alpha/beta hydrolase fold protein [Cellulomonas flavigena DSM 20109]|uniref:Alpha/beta hydrolase fold protein n=1 Tax=Cellulomonas flavigena (strain ATCC 482 / DSM 20109 / BCRC 11376 / JCM 18109 / NBRC 3775 / NCIMB 8073 / NRS 134) TaxID=446466 RepID=D5UDF5_CELFN|nr:alpha/beta hydrolase [Cellulomonas flavigena]ADG76411.1 alpha/beta hydrolase fold protein [Cellulomonas flavigena DSM 20109]
MTETTLTVTSAGHDLPGTLTTPAGPGPFPTVLLVPGSGPVDRDSNHKRMRLDVTRQLAVALGEAGLATFRYDKRGVGRSSGDWREAGFHESGDDVAAVLDALAARPEVDASRLVLVGHSEGALHAIEVAARRTDLAGVALLSTSAQPGLEVLRWQSRNVAGDLPAFVRGVLRLMRTDIEKKTEQNRVAIAATTGDVARIGGVRINARWHREFMAYDPRVDLPRITVPVLALTGSKDLQVDPADLTTVAELVAGPVETHVVQDVTHVLRRQDGRASLSAYKEEIRRPLDERVVDLLVTWARRVTTVAAAA